MSDQEVPADIGAEPATTAPAGFPPPHAEPATTAPAGFPPPGAEELSPPGAEELSGWRIAAALIDLVVLACVAVILSAVTGQISSSSSTGFQITLNAAWTLVLV